MRSIIQLLIVGKATIIEKYGVDVLEPFIRNLTVFKEVIDITEVVSFSLCLIVIHR